MRKLLFLVFLFFSLTIFAKPTQKQQQVKISSVHDISGFIGDRIRLNREIYLKNFPIEQYADFVINRNHTDWIWTKAEQHGKWIESSYLSALQSGDSLLLNKVHDILYRIIASQEDNGYLGATAKSFRTPDRPIRGMDPYELYFVFHAFLTVYEETSDTYVLESVKRLADYFIENFGPGKNEFWPSDFRYPENIHKELTGHSKFAGHSVHYSWEATLLNDPVARLYQLTGEKRYLDWAKWLVDNIDRWSGWNSFSRLDEVADGKIGVDKLQPYVHSHTFHMNFMGFLRLYMITGDESYLRKVIGAWNDIYNRQMYITGGVSVCEHYEHDFVKPLSGNIVETCATMSWMQLTEMLLQITGDTKYADALEKIMLNHVFAAQDVESGVCRYHTPPCGAKPEGIYRGPDCCSGSGHRIISLLPTFFYAQNGNEFFINQYVSSSYDDGALVFSLKGDYALDGKVSIEISKAARTRIISLRIPSWCTSPSVSLNGVPIADVKSGTYCRIERRFSSGDRIDISFPLEERWVVRENHSNYPSRQLPGGEIMYDQAPADRIPVAYLRGPVVYCLDMIRNPQLRNDDMDISRDLVIDDKALPVKSDVQPSDLMSAAYTTQAKYMGAPVKVTLTPFANIGLWKSKDFIPDRNSRAYTYSIWLYNSNQ